MLSVLSALSAAKKPVFILPGTFTSSLFVDANDVDLQWYCPKDLPHQLLWFQQAFFIPPIANCVVEWLTVKYDKVNKRQTSLPGLKISPAPIGGLSGIVDFQSTVLNGTLVTCMDPLIQRLKNAGYTDGYDLFAAPYDWRLGIAGQFDFFAKLKGAIEDTYAKQGNTKVFLFGHSFGGFALQYFISTYVDQDWAQKYVDSAVLAAPSFAGSGAALSIAWSKSLPQFLYLPAQFASDLIESVGAIHTHFYNPAIYGDKVFIWGPDGTTYAAKDIPDLLVKYGKVHGDNIDLLNLNYQYLSKMPDAPKAMTHLIYNTGLPTTSGIVLDQNWNISRSVNEGGDGTVVGEGLAKYCSTTTSQNLKCVNLNKGDSSGDHCGMLYNDGVLDYIMNVVNK